MFLSVLAESRRFLSALSVRQRQYLKLLLALDVVFIATHLAIAALRRTGVLAEAEWMNRLRIDNDQCIPEIVGYLKLATIIVLLLAIVAKSGGTAYLLAAAATAYLLLDDGIGLHERVGAAIFPDRDAVLVHGVHWADVAEFVMMAGPGLMFVALLLHCCRRSSGNDCTFAGLFGLAFLVLGGFAVVVDLLHQIARAVALPHQGVFTVLEDGGEMIMVTALLTLALAAWSHRRDPLADRPRIDVTEPA